jgi:hypothetical protein
MKEKNEKSKLSTNKIALIVLTVIILGPLIFFGSCTFGLVNLGNNNSFMFPVFILVGLLLAIILCYVIIRAILKK